MNVSKPATLRLLSQQPRAGPDTQLLNGALPPADRSSSTNSVPQSESREAASLTAQRLAKPSDIGQARNISNGAKRYWINHLCKYRNAQNLAWPKLTTAVADLVVSERSIQNYRRELIEANWICLPDGDAGGRPPAGASGGVVIHLHPDGKACRLPKVESKQRAAQAKVRPKQTADLPTAVPKGEEPAPFPDLTNTRKGEAVAPLRVKKTTEKGENGDAHIRNELLIELLKEEPSTTSSRACATNREDLPRSPGDDNNRRLPDLGDVRNSIFEDLERMCDPLVEINGQGRARILRAGVRNSFSLAQLRYAWRRDARVETGGVIRLAENWAIDAAHFKRWPQCFDCEDTGVLVLQQKLALSAGNENHEYLTRAGQRSLARLYRDYQRNGPAYCACARGVELQDDSRSAATEQPSPPQVPGPSERDRERPRDLVDSTASKDPDGKGKDPQGGLAVAPEIAALESAHICPACKGTRGSQRYGAWHLCLSCLGMGDFWTEEEFRCRGECPQCRGTGKIRDRRQQYGPTCKRPPRLTACPSCGATGKLRPVCPCL